MTTGGTQTEKDFDFYPLVRTKEARLNQPKNKVILTLCLPGPPARRPPSRSRFKVCRWILPPTPRVLEVLPAEYPERPRVHSSTSPPSLSLKLPFDQRAKTTWWWAAPLGENDLEFLFWDSPTLVPLQKKKALAFQIRGREGWWTAGCGRRPPTG